MIFLLDVASEVRLLVSDSGRGGLQELIQRKDSAASSRIVATESTAEANYRGFGGP